MSKAKLIFGTRKALDPDSDNFGHQQAVERATIEEAYKWFSETLPVHFTEAAYLRYSYHGRSIKYNRRKKKKYGHNNPMVYTGTMRAELLRGRPVVATNSRKTKSVIQLRLPYARAANLWVGTNAANPSLNFHRELTAFDNADAARFETNVQDRIPVIWNEILASDPEMDTETFEV